MKFHMVPFAMPKYQFGIVYTSLHETMRERAITAQGMKMKCVFNKNFDTKNYSMDV